MVERRAIAVDDVNKIFFLFSVFIGKEGQGSEDYRWKRKEKKERKDLRKRSRES